MVHVENITKREKIICYILFIVSPIIGYLQIPARKSIVSLIFIIIFITYWTNSKTFKKIALSTPLKIWLGLTIFHCFNALSKHVPEVNILDLLHGLKIYACICIFYYWGTINFSRTIKILVSCFTIYLLISFIVCDFSGEEANGRMTGVIYATGLGQTAAITCFYIAYYSYIKKFTTGKTLIYLLLPLIVIILTQSRNSLAMFSICLIAIIYCKLQTKITPQRLILIVIASIMISYLIYLLVVNSSFGTRIIEKSIQHENSYQFENYSTGTIFDAIVGDRLIYYALGFSYFLQSPLTGIGMWNYEYVSNGNYPLHTEYMVHLCEGGIIAFILWSSFIGYIIFGIIKYIPKGSIKIIALFSIFQILFCAIYARLFYSEFFYPIIGITLALITTSKNYIILKQNDKK